MNEVNYFEPSRCLTRPSLWRAITGFIVWAVAFVVLYVGHALGCLYVPTTIDASTLSTMLTTVWLAHLVVAVVLAWRSRLHLRRFQRDDGTEAHARFMWRVTFLLDAFAAGAVFVTGLPVLAITACTA